MRTEKRVLSLLLALLTGLSLLPAPVMAAEWETVEIEAAEIAAPVEASEVVSAPAATDTAAPSDDDWEFVPGVVPEECEYVYPTAEEVAAARPELYRGELGEKYDGREFQTSVKDQGGNGLCWAFSAYGALEASLKKNGMGDQDFSELHMGYSTSTYKVNGADVNKEQGFGVNTITDGGNRTYSAAYLMRGTSLSGTVAETEDKYVSKVTEFRALDVSEKKTKTYYARDILFLADSKDENKFDIIKRAVMVYGGVTASTQWDDSFYNDKEGAYYCNGELSDKGHMMLIVGWDDKYAMTNFLDGKQPENDGAWLVKNSWGGSKGKEGFFWISYEDKYFPDNPAVYTGADRWITGSHVYESDYTAGGESVGVNDATSKRFAKVFQRQFDQNDTTARKITSVRVFLPKAPVTVKADVITPFENFDSYGFSAKGSVEATYPGWYTIDLTTPAELGDSQKFAVVVEVSGAAGKVYIGHDSRNKIDKDSVNVYWDSNGEYKELTDPKDSDKGYNLCIKALAVPTVGVHTVTVENGTGGGKYAKGETVKIKANEDTNKPFEKWTTTVDVSFADETAAQTTFTMPDKDVTVTATYKTVTTLAADNVTLDPTSFSYDGKAHTPNVTVKVGDETLTKDTDYTLVFKKDNTEVVSPTDAGGYTVVVTGKGNYVGTVEKTFTITGAGITGTPKFEQTLTSVLTPAAGGLTYQWYRGDKADFTPADGNKIADANGKDYKLLKDDIGKYIKVVITKDTTPYTSAAVGPVEKLDGPAAPESVTATVTDTTITVTAPAQTDPATYEYSVDGETWQDDVKFANLTANTSYTVHARKKADDTHKAGAEKTAEVKTDPLTIKGVTLSGKAEFGETLTAAYEPKTVAEKDVTYAWFYGDTADKCETAIEGVTGSTYRITLPETVGKFIKVTVTQKVGDKTVTVSATTETAVTSSGLTVKFETNGGSAVEDQKVQPGKTATKPEDPTRTSYVFAGWYSDKELTKAFDFSTPITESITLYAKWDESAVPQISKIEGAACVNLTDATAKVGPVSVPNPDGENADKSYNVKSSMMSGRIKLAFDKDLYLYVDADTRKPFGTKSKTSDKEAGYQDFAGKGSDTGITVIGSAKSGENGVRVFVLEFQNVSAKDGAIFHANDKLAGETNVPDANDALTLELKYDVASGKVVVTTDGTWYADKSAALEPTKVEAPIPEPGVPQEVTATASGGKVAVTWEEVDDATKYAVYRKTSGESGWSLLSSKVKETTYTDDTVKANTTYYYRVKAYCQKWGNVSAYAKVKMPAAPPATVKASVKSGVITVSWSKVTGAKKYALYRKAASEDKWELLDKTLTVNSYADKEVDKGETYYYRVRVSNGKWSGYSVKAKAKVPLNPPAPPENIRATERGDRITVTWDRYDGATKYAVYRRASSETKWTRLSSSYAGTSYTDYDAKAGTTYYYCVRTYNGEWSDASAAVKAKIPVPKPDAPKNVKAKADDGRIAVTWSKVSGAKRYAIYRRADGESKWTLLSKTLTGVSYSDNALQANVSYSYCVRAYNGSWSGYSDAASAKVSTVAPDAPVDLRATAKNGKVTVKWVKVDGVTRYAVYRRASGESKWTLLDKTLTGTSYVDGTVKAGVTYDYRVRAYNGVWSGYSEPVRVKVPAA